MQELVFPHMYRAAIDQHGDAQGIIDGDYRSSWSRHDERVSRLAHALAHQLGVERTDRFAVLALNGLPTWSCGTPRSSARESSTP
jgi:acyl-CoA synthetase (AMP-forming)/AMP-acid ligase II